MNRTLWPHQVDGMAMLRQSLASGKRRPMLQAPTGSGKTLLTAAILEGALRKSKRVVFIVPAISLINQSVKAFYDEGITEVGVIQANHPMTNSNRPVQVASVQTLGRRQRPQADLFVIDEAHILHQTHKDLLTDEALKSVPMIGLSATPWRQGLGKLYDDLLVVTTTRKLIDGGFLSPFKVYAPSHPDLAGVRTVAGDFHEGELADRMNQVPLVADIVDNWLQHGEWRPTLCFAVDRAHAKHLQERFLAAGVPAGYIDCNVDGEDREPILAQFRRGELKVICNVGTMTTGVDLDVRCLILARPTRSESLFVQIIGRGLRTATGKDDCIARDSLVLTDCGEVRIQDVTIDHKVWDGVSFVSHKGAVCRGVQAVITYDGVTCTPDHKVMTDAGWEALADASRGGRRIARTGIGGQPVRLINDRVSQSRGVGAQSTRRGAVWALLCAAHGAVSQHEEAAENRGMPFLQAAHACHGASLALPSMSGSTKALSGPIKRAIWRSWNRVSLQRTERSGSLDSGESKTSGSIIRNRPNRQRWTLRGWQSSLGTPCGKCEQQFKVEGQKRTLSVFSPITSRYSLCGQNVGKNVLKWINERANNRKMVESVMQAEREVWDILDAGPLQRFTVNGRLVHNCLVFDHSDTHARLGFVTDIHHDYLDGGTDRGTAKPRPAPIPKECPECHFLRPAKVSTCPACGFKPVRQCDVEVEDGELIELGAAASANLKMVKAEKQRWFSMLVHMAGDRGKTRGWAAKQFELRFGEWPRGLREIATPPTPDVISYVKSRQIAWAKSRGRAA